MKRLYFGVFASAVAVLGLSHSPDAAAASTWDLNATACNPSVAGTSYNVATPVANTISCSTGVPAETITITAWSNAQAGAVGNYRAATIGDFGTYGMGAYSGSGESGTDNQHALDNVTTGCVGGTNAVGTGGCGGSQEFLLINFGPYKVNLSALTIGFRGVDADVAVLRWDGIEQTGTQMATTLGGKNIGTLTGANAWSLIGTESMDGVMNDTSGVNLGNQVSSWWIVSTYYGTTAAQTLGALGLGDDRFKLLSLTGNVCTTGYNNGTNGNANGGTCSPGVPEPGSLALAGLALAGVFASRRKVKALF